MAPIQGLAPPQGKAPVETDDLVVIDGQQSGFKEQQKKWTAARKTWSQWKKGKRTPVRHIVDAWLRGDDPYKAYPVLIVWFDGLIDEDNSARLRSPDTQLPGGAWALIGQALPQEPKPGKKAVAPEPVLVYVLARPEGIDWGRKVAADLAAADPNEDRHAFDGGAIELLPGTAPALKATVQWTGRRSVSARSAGQAEDTELQSGADISLPATVTVKSVGGPAMTVSRFLALQANGGDELPKLSVDVRFSGFIPPAALPSSWLPVIGEPSVPVLETESVVDWGLQSGHVTDLARRLTFASACPSAPIDHGVQLTWYFGEALPCPEPKRRPGQPASPPTDLVKCAGRVQAQRLSETLGDLSPLPAPNARLSPECHKRIGFSVVNATGSGHESTVATRPVVGVLRSTLSMEGKVNPECAPRAVAFSESLELFNAAVLERKEKCPNAVWSALAMLKDDLKSAFATSTFTPEKGGPITKLRGLELLTVVAFDLVEPTKSQWLEKSDVLIVRYVTDTGVGTILE